jgi:hypothetical protein
MEWRSPDTGDDFEHDVSSSHSAAVVMLVLVCVLAVVLVVWTPADVVVPLWLVLIIALLVLFFPLRWALRRPWHVTAEVGDDGDGQPTEKWEGKIRGVLKVRQQVTQIARSIAEYGSPDIDGPLKPVFPIPDDATPAMKAPPKQDDDD